MTEDAIILETLKFINRETQPPKTFVNISDTIWWGFDLKKKEHLRTLIFKQEIANQNMDNRWEFRMVSAGDIAVELGEKQLEIDFLKSIQKQPNIEFFMVNHFIKPDPKSPLTTHETDSGVIFLKELKGKGLINFDKDDLLHISNDWYEENPPINKRWFDTVDKNRPFIVELTKLGKSYLLLEDAVRPITIPTIIQITPQTIKSHSGIISALKKAMWYIVKNILKFIFWVLIGIASGCFIIMIVNYCHHRGFSL